MVGLHSLLFCFESDSLAHDPALAQNAATLFARRQGHWHGAARECKRGPDAVQK